MKTWFSDVGGPTMVGADATAEILKITPPRLAKNASPGNIFPTITLRIYFLQLRIRVIIYKKNEIILSRIFIFPE